MNAAKGVARAAGGAAVALSKRLVGRARHEFVLGREVWGPGGTPLVHAERIGRAGAEAPLWRVVFVGRRRLLADFDFLAPRGDPWRIAGEGAARSWRRLLAGSCGSSGAEPVIRVVERWWGLPTRLARARADAPPPHLKSWASHLDTFCPVAPSRAGQEACLTSPELRARWRAAKGLVHEVSVSPACVRRFYDKMVAGQNRSRFGDTGALLPFSAFAEVLGRGGALVKVRTEAPQGRWVSGVMLAPGSNGRGLTVFRPGIAGADALPAGRLAELTSFHDIAVLDVARERGLEVLGLGLTRAQAKNPIYRHKKALGATFLPAARGPRFTVHAPGPAAALLARYAPLVAPG